MKNRDKIKSIYNNILVSEELDNKILNETIYKEKFNNKKLILKYAIIFIVFASFTTIGVVAKDYIKEYFVSFKEDKENNKAELNITIKDKVKISKNGDLKCNENLTIKEIENHLGIKLLNPQFYNKDTFTKDCEIIRNIDGKIRRVKMINDDSFPTNEIYQTNKSKKRFEMGIEFMTNYAEQDDEKYFSEKWLVKASGVMPKEGIEEKIENYFIKNLKVNAIIINATRIIGNKYEVESPDFPINIAYFVYNGVFYSFTGQNFTTEELIQVLENIE